MIFRADFGNQPHSLSNAFFRFREMIILERKINNTLQMEYPREENEAK